MPKKSTSTKKEYKAETKPKKKVAVKKVARAKIQTKTSSKPKEKAQPKVVKSDSVNHSVKLPSMMPESSVTKARDLKKELDFYISKSVQRVAYVTAFCFIAVGASLSILNEAEFDNQTIPQSALIYDFDKELGEMQTTETKVIESNVQSVTETSKFEFLTKFPKNLTEDFRVNFRATNLSEVKIKLAPSQQTDFFELEPSPLLEDKYRADIKPNLYQKGYYKLIVYIKPADGAGTKAYSSNEFFIGTAEDELNFQKKYFDQKMIIEPDAEPNEVVIEENYEEEPRKTISELQIRDIKNETITGMATIVASYSDNLKFVELFSRPVNSLEYRFISLATKRSENWVFEFNSNNLPNGEYELVARSKTPSNEIESNPVIVKVSNLESSNRTPLRKLEEVEEVEERESNPQESRYLETSIDNLDERTVNSQAQEILFENKAIFDDLLKRYATAVQSGDTTLIDLAKNEISKKRRELALETIRNSNLREISDDIDLELERKTNILIQRVDRFEQLRKDKNSNETSLDSDGDGITDFDEINIFGTNPKKADSDNDGFNDGIEVMRGFDPTDETSEAIIEFESPRDFKGLQREDVLSVESVIPIVTKNAESDVIQTEISGKSFPESFVTLYIFSTPTVVTIKTDSDGSFVYTFSKELEDGEHEVYAAVTDNTGSIIAQSRPFSFVKTAEAYDVITEDELPQLAIASSERFTDNSYRSVLGMAVLALGVVLLMLGISLRIKNSTSEQTTSSINDRLGKREEELEMPN